MKSILVAVDFSECTDTIVAHAATVAEAASAKLWLLYVGPPQSDMFGQQLVRKVVDEDVPPELQEAHETLQRMARDLKARGVEVEARLMRGKAVETILEEAGQLDVELIVIGAHGRSALYRAIVGSVSEGILRGSTRPVLVVPSARGR